MVNHCANPNCHKPLHYLRDGKVFLFSGKNLPDGGANSHSPEHYWLCGTCSKQWKIISDSTRGVQLVETGHRRKRHYPIVAPAHAS